MNLIESRPEGLYCTIGDFFIDPLLPVRKAIISHAHADHFCSGCDSYYGHRHTIHFLKLRMGRIAPMKSMEYGETFNFNGVKVSLHSAGHMPGSAQIRIEYAGEIWVVTGDLKPEGNAFCAPFDTLSCDHLITECTFSDPLFRWPSENQELLNIHNWYKRCLKDECVPVLSAYAIGKAQKMQNLLAKAKIPVLVHPTIAKFNKSYKKLGFDIPAFNVLKDGMSKKKIGEQLVLAPPSVFNTAWMLRFSEYSAGLCSGWNLKEGTLKGRGADIGFTISDHADFHSLVRNIKQSDAQVVYLMHGDKESMYHHLKDMELEIKILKYQ